MTSIAAYSATAADQGGTQSPKVQQDLINHYTQELRGEDGKGAKKAPGAFRTISEVADDLDVPQHVLRFWETKFSQVKPLKRGGGRRYYGPEDVALLKHIHHLLYTEGYTIKGAQKLLKGQGKNQIAAQTSPDDKTRMVASTKIQAGDAKPAPSTSQTPWTGAQNMPDGQGGSIYLLSEKQRDALEEMLAELKALRALFPSESEAA